MERLNLKVEYCLRRRTGGALKALVYRKNINVDCSRSLHDGLLLPVLKQCEILVFPRSG